MFGQLPATGQTGRILKAFWRDVAVRSLFVSVVATLTFGTICFHFIEGWGFVDAFYFCVVTLTTIGYGDLTPTTAGGKLFTVAYIFAGVGIIAGFITTLAQRMAQRAEERAERRAAARERRQSASSGRRE